ncbi:putative Eukaryotic initiation factor 4A-I protein, partial [Naja naja]
MPVLPNQRPLASRMAAGAAQPRSQKGMGANGRETGQGDNWAGRSPGGCYKEARGGRGQDLFYRMSASQESR